MSKQLGKLGRIAALDIRDKRFSLPTRKMPTSGYKYWYTGDPWDQGYSSECVAYSWLKYLFASPVRNIKVAKECRDFYRLCQQNDEWPGENYDGTSVRAGAKVAQQQGYIEEYYWAFNIEAAVNHVLNTGPMVVGTDWYSKMFNPINGYLVIGGGIVGGHAYLIKGVNVSKKNPDGTKGAFRIFNSWGRWGQNGCAWLSFDIFRFLLTNGEACTANEIKR